jgi:hypothetical protein
MSALYRLIVEIAITRDRKVDDVDANGRSVGWHSISIPPDGDGWEIADSSSDRKTKWRRRVLVPVSS